MPTIRAEGHYTLLTKRSSDEGLLDLAIPCSDFGPAQVVANFADNTIVTTLSDVEVDTAFLEVESSQWSHDDALPSEVRKRADEITSALSAATRRALELARSFLRLDWIPESAFSSKGECWFNERGIRFQFPRSFRVVRGHGGSFLPLDADTSSKLQKLIDDRIVPLRAFRHLNRAKVERQPHHKWIDATIAAELAIKEVICIKHPNIEAILSECPSPPLDKLYGVLCEKYMGTRSPYLKTIRDGVVIRNRVMHRHNSDRIDPQEAVNYVATVEAAIFHLLTLAYPESAMVAESYLLARHSLGVADK